MCVFAMRVDVQLKMCKTPADLLGAHPCLAWELIVEYCGRINSTNNHQSHTFSLAVGQGAAVGSTLH